MRCRKMQRILLLRIAGTLEPVLEGGAMGLGFGERKTTWMNVRRIRRKKEQLEFVSDYWKRYGRSGKNAHSR
jgi:hypothetical protein